MALLGAAAVVVEVSLRGWWGFATSWIDLSAIAAWLSLAEWLSGWAFERADGWWHVPSFLGAAVSVIGVAFLLVLAVMWLISEHPDILTDDSKQKPKRGRSKRRRTRSSWRPPNARGALAGVGLCVLAATASVVMLLTGWSVEFGAWAGEILGDLVVGWYEQQFQ